MKVAAIATLVYGLLVAAGGLTGYVQARSVPSLISGLLLGVALLVSGWLIWQGNLAAGYLSEVLTLALALYFGYRFVSTNKFLPGGMMLIVSFIALFFLFLGTLLQMTE